MEIQLVIFQELFIFKRQNICFFELKMNHQDWSSIVFSKRNSARNSPRDGSATSSSTSSSTSKTVVRRPHGSGMTRAQRKAAESDDVDKIETVSLSLGKQIQQARCAKGLNQKTLAQKINEKQQVVQNYESGRAIPNPQVLNKLRRVLGVRLSTK